MSMEPLGIRDRDHVDGNDDSASPRSQLSIDDLAAAPVKTHALNDTMRVEAELQHNLQQQQAHYARQRELFAALGRDSVLGRSPTAGSTSSKSGYDDDDVDTTARLRRRATVDAETPDGHDGVVHGRTRKFELHLQQLQHELKGAGATTKKHVTTTTHDTKGIKRPSHRCTGGSDGDDVDDDDATATTTDEIERLQRKAKRIAEYHARIGSSSSAYVPHGSRRRLDASATHYESSNDALRKQLELLRRLQLENNRFRHENRSLREQNDVLEAQTTLHTREITRLTDEVSELSLHVQHDQLELATAAQNVRKMKQLQKQLEAVQTERDSLQTAVQEAADRDAQLRLRTQNEIESVVQESKHLKRSLKQSRQHEARLQDQVEELKHATAAVEQNAVELTRQLLDAKRESSELAARLSEKTTRIDAIESSASQCVERMEVGMEALQKAHTSEREKRKKLEKLRETVQSEMGTLELAHSKLEDRVRELESYNAQLQQRLQDWKLEKNQDKQFQDEKCHEFQERHKNDAKTIAVLRDECAAYEQQLESARASVVEIRKEVAVECNALRKDVEALRNYIEDAQRASVVNESASNEAAHPTSLSSSVPPVSSRARREELWVQLPELQFLQGAVGGLRNEAMTFVGDFQRARHQLRQHGAKLSAAQERVVELEHARSEDALTRKELADQRVLAEQAREITLREKMEVLTWSQQACEKSERLEVALAACANGMQSVVKKARRAVDAVAAVGPRHSDDDGTHKAPLVLAGTNAASDEDPVAHGARLVTLVEREVHELTARVETLADEYKAAASERDEHQGRIGRLEKELEAQRQDHVAVVAEIEALHTRSVAEKQALFSRAMRAVGDERDALQKDLVAERTAVAAMQSVHETLEDKQRELEQDVPVLVTIAQLFALVVPPLVLQVNDLLTQKRVLARENAEYAMAHEQVECIGQVLRELVPAGTGTGGDGSDYAEQQRRQRRRRFRRVVIAVFAINRFQHGGFAGSATGTGESVYGVCTSLKPVKKATKLGPAAAASLSSSSCLPPQTVIKVLAPKPVPTRLKLRALLDRLRALDVTAKLGDAIEASALEGNNHRTSVSASSFGSLLMHVLAEMVDPSSKDVLVDDTAGTFHCRALLERRKAAGTRWHDSAIDHSDTRRLSTVDLIRKRILALGKRLEDLHYQRNALQKENYDCQYQLDQQAARLRDMDALARKHEELQRTLEQLQTERADDATATQAALAEKDRALEAREREITTQHEQRVGLQRELAALETTVAELQLEKTELHHALLVATSASAADEEARHKSRLAIDKLTEELRALKQAAKRAHELHERVAWQLEQELAEKATLRDTMEHLQRQKETLERQVACANVRALDESTDSSTDSRGRGDGGGGGEGGDVGGRQSSATGNETTTSSAGLAVSSSSSASSYDRQLQDLSDRIANMRSATSLPFTADSNDEDDNGGGDAREPATMDRANTVRSRRTPASSDTFRSEWQRLDISGVFDEGGAQREDASQRLMGERVGHNDSDGHDGRRRRAGDEIDKVNTAVHDYMDRIDEKLQQMYGIPKSSSRSRPPTTASVIHGSTTATMAVRTKKAVEVRWGSDATELE